MSETAVLLCGHGSRDPEAVGEFEEAAAALRSRLAMDDDFATGYLEFARPTIGESLAAIIQEEAFESLDAPVRIIGALDTPVPYSPSLEDFYLPNEAQIERAARLLTEY